MSDTQKVLRNSRTMAIMTAISRVFGLAREMLIALLLGTTRFADIWNMAFMVPNLFRRFLAEGAMSSALVPTFSEIHAQGDKNQEQAFTRAFFTLILVSSAVITILMIVMMPVALPALVELMTPGKANLAIKDAVLPTQVMFPYLVFVSVAAVCQGILNVYDRFGLPAATPVFLNICVIALGYGLRHQFGNPVWGLCIGVLVGGFLQFALQWAYLARMQIWLWPSMKVWTRKTAEAVGLWLPMTLAAGVYQINVLVSQSIAFGLFDGAMAALNYANRLIELVLGVFATAVSTSILPMLSVQKLLPDRSAMRHNLWRGLEALSLITLPASAGLVLCGYSLISWLFQRGRFDSHSLNLVYGALLVHAMSLLPVSWYRVISQTFFAFKHVRTSLVLTILAATLNIVFCLLFPGLFDRSYAHIGIALATVCYSWILVIIAIRLVAKRYALAPDRTFLWELMKITLATIAFVPVWLPLELQKLGLVELGLRLAGSIAVFVGVGYVLRIKSLHALWRQLRRRVG